MARLLALVLAGLLVACGDVGALTRSGAVAVPPATVAAPIEIAAFHATAEAGLNRPPAQRQAPGAAPPTAAATAPAKDSLPTKPAAQPGAPPKPAATAAPAAATKPAAAPTKPVAAPTAAKPADASHAEPAAKPADSHAEPAAKPADAHAEPAAKPADAHAEPAAKPADASHAEPAAKPADAAHGEPAAHATEAPHGAPNPAAPAKSGEVTKPDEHGGTPTPTAARPTSLPSRTPTFTRTATATETSTPTPTPTPLPSPCNLAVRFERLAPGNGYYVSVQHETPGGLAARWNEPGGRVLIYEARPGELGAETSGLAVGVPSAFTIAQGTSGGGDVVVRERGAGEHTFYFFNGSSLGIGPNTATVTYWTYGHCP